MQNTKLAFEQREVVLSRQLHGKYATVDVHQNNNGHTYFKRTISSIYSPKPMLYV